jgi:hypothetical protein
MSYTTITKRVEVELDLDDVLEFIEDTDKDDINQILKAIRKDHPLTTMEDPVFEEVLKSDSWESRDKIAFLKTIFDNMSLEEMKNKLK